MLVSVVILCLALLGAGIFAKSAVVALCVIVVAYASFLLTLFLSKPHELVIPQSNTYAYMVPSNASDPESEKVPDFNQTLTATFTSFR